MKNIKDYFTREILEILFLIIYVVILVGIFSMFFGFGAGGFEREAILQKNGFYLNYGHYFLIGLIAIKMAALILFKKAKDKSLEGSFIHDPEQSIFSKFLIIRNPFLLYFFSIILFSLLAWWLVQLNQTAFFMPTPIYEQQFSTGADLFFNVYPASPVETLGALFLISLFDLFMAILLYKGKFGRGFFMITSILVYPIISLVYGLINHAARYSSSDVAYSNVALFWFVGGEVTALTQSVIPFLAMHDVNNFYKRLSELFSSDIITFLTFVSLAILIISFIVLYLYLKKRKNNRELMRS